jgi:hypothetical protein
MNRIMIAETSRFIHIYFMIMRNGGASGNDEPKCIKNYEKKLRASAVENILINLTFYFIYIE